MRLVVEGPRRGKFCTRQMGSDGHASSGGPVAGAEHRNSGSAGAAGPVVAHVILVGSWVAPPVMLLAGGIAAGWPFGIAGVAAGTAVTGALFVGPASPSYRGALCSGLCALAMAAGEGNRRALAAAGGVAVLTAALHVRWRTSERFYSLITQTLRGRDYYAAAEVRGAIDTVRPGRNFYAVHPHGCLSAGWTWNVSADRPLPPCLCPCMYLAVADPGLDPGRKAHFGDRVQSRRAHLPGVCALRWQLFWNTDFHRRTGRICFLIGQMIARLARNRVSMRRERARNRVRREGCAQSRKHAARKVAMRVSVTEIAKYENQIRRSGPRTRSSA